MTSGSSGAPVFCDGDCFLKRIGAATSAESLLQKGLRAEAQILPHLNRQGFPAPVLQDAGEDFLITRRLPGRSLREDLRRHQPLAVVETIADWFKRLHHLDLPLDAIDRGVEAELAEARVRIDLNLIKIEDVATLPGRPSPLQLWSELRETRPEQPVVTLTHGDPWPCNLFFDGDSGCGIIDWARAGVGPPERDLAIIHRALTHHYGPQWAGLFLECYGSHSPARLKWFERLDYLF